MERGSKILLIASSVLILAFIVFGFFLLLNNSSTNNSSGSADTVSVQCQNACDINQRAGFCDVERKVSGGPDATCDSLAVAGLHEVQACPNIDCGEAIDRSCVSGLGSEWKTPENGNCPSGGIKRTSSDNAPVEGQLCCYYEI